MDLLERQYQLDELMRHPRDAQARSGKIAFLAGEAGAGKSALVEGFAAQASRMARVRGHATRWAHGLRSHGRQSLLCAGAAVRADRFGA
jgi:predicted ATPase